MAYEKKVVRHLRRRFPNATLHYHEWIQYADANGSGYAEPEAFIVLRDFVLLFECKRTGHLHGKQQMVGLYAPLLAFLFEKPVRSLLVCKHITHETPGPLYESPEAFILSGQDFGTWHWLPTP